MCDLTNPIFQNETKARKFLESQRWADGVYCLSCGQLDTVKPYAMKSKAGKAVKGWYHCRTCRKKFTVRVGTLYERSHIPLHKWLLATHLMCASKKGVSAHQLHRMIGVTYKSAWFMAHRIREGMKDDVAASGPMGGEGKTIEADETYIGNKLSKKQRLKQVKYIRKDGKIHKYSPRGPVHKHTVVSLVERGGRVRSFHVKSATANKVSEILFTNADRKSRLMTDESKLYTTVGNQYADHETVTHRRKEYVRGEAYTNTIEGFFSIFKRGMRGIYQHCGEQHLQRYLSEFDFRYSNRTMTDAERTIEALKGIEGKRLTYRRIGEARYA